MKRTKGIRIVRDDLFTPFVYHRIKVAQTNFRVKQKREEARKKVKLEEITFHCRQLYEHLHNYFYISTFIWSIKRTAEKFNLKMRNKHDEWSAVIESKQLFMLIIKSIQYSVA